MLMVQLLTKQNENKKLQFIKMFTKFWYSEQDKRKNGLIMS